MVIEEKMLRKVLSNSNAETDSEKLQNFLG